MSGNIEWDAINRWNTTCRVDLRSSVWTFENCKIVTDYPRVVVHTLTLGKPSYMYTTLKLVPALYDFDMRSIEGVDCTCTTELIEVRNDGTRHSRNRCATAADMRQTMRWMITADSNVELRIRFNERVTMRVVSFKHMIVRSRRKLVIPFYTNVLSGVQNMVRLTYRLNDMHRVIKMVHSGMKWLKTVEGLINDVISTIASPLWDPCDNHHVFSDQATSLRTALVDEAPLPLFATNAYYRISLDSQLRMPLISRTLVHNLSDSLLTRDFADDVQKAKVLDDMHHALHYINFMLIEYVEFKQKLQEKIARNNRMEEVGTIRTVDLPLEFSAAIKPSAV